MRFGNSSSYGVAPTFSTDLLPYEALAGSYLLPQTSLNINAPGGGVRFDVGEAKEIQVRVRAQGLSVANEPSPWGSLIIGWHNRADLTDQPIVQDFMVLVQAASSVFRPTLIGYEPETFQYNLAPLGKYFTLVWTNWCQLGTITQMQVAVTACGIRTSAQDYTILTPDQGQAPLTDPGTNMAILSNPNQGRITWEVWPTPAFPVGVTVYYLMPPMPGLAALAYMGGGYGPMRFIAYALNKSGLDAPLWDTASMAGSTTGGINTNGYTYTEGGLVMPAQPWCLAVIDTSGSSGANFRGSLTAEL